MDHVPPRAMFPKVLPAGTRLVTAPACVACHEATKKDDVPIRNLFVSELRSEINSSVQNELAERRDRSLDRSMERSCFEISDLQGMMIDVDILTSAGIYVETRKAFKLRENLLEPFLQRLTRALLWHEFQTPYFVGQFQTRLDLPHPPEIYSTLLSEGRARKVHDVFAYGVLIHEDNAYAMAQFYGGMEFTIWVRGMVTPRFL
jgi:hypothetical protein